MGEPLPADSLVLSVRGFPSQVDRCASAVSHSLVPVSQIGRNLATGLQNPSPSNPTYGLSPIPCLEAKRRTTENNLPPKC